jgi:putative ABC transport system permease protein
MLKNYLKIVLRNMAKQKTFTFINIAGLAVGMACTILIMLWVQDEINYDRFHKNADDIYTVVMDWKSFGGSRSNKTYAPLAPTCKEEIPEVINYVRIQNISRIVVKYKDKAFYEEGGMIADPSIFEVFSFPVVKGNPLTDLTSPFDAIVTESFAKKYFGDEDPIGKEIEEEGIPITVKVVMKDIPHNSHLQFDFLMSFELARQLPHFPTGWGSPNYPTYVHLQKGSNVADVAQKIAAIVTEHNSYIMEKGLQLFLVPMKDIYLNQQLYPRNTGNRSYVYAFFIIGIFVLVIACINFVNLSMARSSVRLKEVGIRKTVGAFKIQLIKQFMTESILLFMIAFGLAVILSESFLPEFNQISGKQLSINFFDYRFISGAIALIIIIGMISGSYPAFYLSAFKPASIFRKKFSSGRSGYAFRNVLITAQFFLSIILILSTAIVYNQVQFMQNKNLGFDRENIMYIPIKENIGKRYETVKNELLQNPNIISVSAKDCVPTTHTNRTLGIHWEGKRPDQDKIATETLKIDYDYFKTLGLKIVEGRDFSKEFATDATSAFILNEEAIKRMEIQGPVIGKEFTLYQQKGAIIGILRDAYFKSLHKEIEPQVYHILTDMTDVGSEGVVLIRITGKDIPQTISSIERIWSRVNPNAPFEYNFLDKTYNNLYKTEIRIGTILNYFTILAIFISCLGMFGLASFAAERRTKEIGVRKVLGASVSGIVALISKDFIKWVLIANFIAWPIAYIFMNKWLQNFAYRTNIGILTFLFAGMVALCIALLTVSYQSIKAAVANPVESLRYE